MKFQTYNGRNCKDTIEERLASRTTSKSGFNRCVVFWKFAYLLTRISNWGDSKSRIKWDKRSLT
jgi:hypothetical protein